MGSKTVDSATITDWIGKTASGTFQYTTNDRVGSLGTLGQPSPTQVNPITGTALDFPFAGVTFELLGGDILGGLGTSAVVGQARQRQLWHPDRRTRTALDVNQANAGTGRAYLISGNFNNFIGQTINLDTPATLTGPEHRHVREQRHRREPRLLGRGREQHLRRRLRRHHPRGAERILRRDRRHRRGLRPLHRHCSPGRPRRSTSRRSARAARPAPSSPGPRPAARPAGASPMAATSTASRPTAPTSTTCSSGRRPPARPTSSMAARPWPGWPRPSTGCATST